MSDQPPKKRLVRIGRDVFELGANFDGGGQATIFCHPRKKHLALKIYRDVEKCEPDRLRYLIDHPPKLPSEDGQPTFAWPLELVFDARLGCVVGFVMALLKSLVPLGQIANPITRIPEITLPWLYQVAESFLERLLALHAAKYVRVDIQLRNDLASRFGIVTGVDVDSMEHPGDEGQWFRAPVAIAEFQAPELLVGEKAPPPTPLSDAWSAAIVLHILIRCDHPFSFQFLGDGERPTVVTMMRDGLWAEAGRHSHIRPPRNGFPFSHLPKVMRELFVKMFDAGHSTLSLRPTVGEMLEAVRAARREVR